MSFRINLFFALTLTSTLFATERSVAAIDPLSKGPLALSAKRIDAARAAYKDGLIFTDQDCDLPAEIIAETEVPIANLPAAVCKNRTQELVYLESKMAIVACSNGVVDFAMRVSIGSKGIGKTLEGNRRTPLGTYWVGHPRHSKLFGIFIPIGYPNMNDIDKGYTGSSVGIHGPLRFMTCRPDKSLERNWTAGCLAVGRDSQLITLSEWILAHWPTRLTITRE